MDVFLNGWFWTNIVAPLGLPIAGLVPLKLLPLGPTVAPSVRFMAVVKDAQLCWGAVAMGASSFYEFWTAASGQNTSVAKVGVLLLLIFILTLMAMVLAAGASAFSTELLTKPAGGLVAWCKHYTAFVGSLVLSSVSAAAYTALHFALA
jgi:hypothetical protein